MDYNKIKYEFTPSLMDYNKILKNIILREVFPINKIV